MFVKGIRNPMVRRNVDTAWAALVQLPDEIGILRKIMQRLLLCPYDFQHQGMMEYRDRTMRAVSDITGRFFVHPWGVNPSFSSMGGMMVHSSICTKQPRYPISIIPRARI
jgi:hypothetical protein